MPASREDLPVITLPCPTTSGNLCISIWFPNCSHPRRNREILRRQFDALVSFIFCCEKIPWPEATFLRKSLFDYNSKLLTSFQDAKDGTQSTTLTITSIERMNTCPFVSLSTHPVQDSVHEMLLPTVGVSLPTSRRDRHAHWLAWSGQFLMILGCVKLTVKLLSTPSFQLSDYWDDGPQEIGFLQAFHTRGRNGLGPWCQTEGSFSLKQLLHNSDNLLGHFKIEIKLMPWLVGPHLGQTWLAVHRSCLLFMPKPHVSALKTGLFVLLLSVYAQNIAPFSGLFFSTVNCAFNRPKKNPLVRASRA